MSIHLFLRAYCALTSAQNRSGYATLSAVSNHLTATEYYPQMDGFSSALDLFNLFPSYFHVEHDAFGTMITLTEKGREIDFNPWHGKVYVPNFADKLPYLHELCPEESLSFSNLPQYSLCTVLSNRLHMAWDYSIHSGKAIYFDDEIITPTGRKDLNGDEIYMIARESNQGNTMPYVFHGFYTAPQHANLKYLQHISMLPTDFTFTPPADLKNRICNEHIALRKHALLGHPDRKPSDFYVDSCPNNFEVCDAKKLSGKELQKYEDALYKAYEMDQSAYKTLLTKVRRFAQKAHEDLKQGVTSLKVIYYSKLHIPTFVAPIMLSENVSDLLYIVFERNTLNEVYAKTMLTPHMVYRNTPIDCGSNNCIRKAS